MTLNELLSRKIELDNEITLMLHRVRELKDEVAQIEADVHRKMKQEGLEKSGINNLNVHFKQEIAPRVIDWAEFFTFVKNNERYDFLHKRINSRAFKTHIDEGGTLPGVEVDSYEKLSFRKV